MKISKYIKISSLLVLSGLAGCTKLTESYTTTIPASQAATVLTADLLLARAYNDIPGPFTGQSNVFSLEENSTDESLVPTRGGDWDDNGVWRVVHNHTWNADHQQVIDVFNGLNAMNFDATNVLGFNPSKTQAAEARVLRAIALYYLLDIYNQFPVRNPGDTLLNAPKVYFGVNACDFIIAELNAALPDLNPANKNTQIGPDACKFMLMKCYLNRGAYKNRAQPSFDDADLLQVITLGNQIISSNRYSYMPNYFGNFNYSNSSSTEGIFIYPGTPGQTVNNPGMNARWMMGFHYNEYTGQAPNAGWNGFSTTSDFYNSFSLGGTTNYSLADTSIDTRIGRRTTSDPTTTINSGIRPGFLVGQQYDQNGVALKDRKGNPLSFDPNIASTMIETGSNLEVTGIRVAKYVPDFSDPGGKYYSSNSGNSFMFFRYPEVVLMVAEAYMRPGANNNTNAGVALVSALRQARGASAITSLPLVNTSNVDDPNTLLAERGRELYFESVRRTDLIRFGVYLLPWQYKPSDDPKNLIFPVPNQALGVNPNLVQNPGY
ncbi:MAG TPA: RagB/SusD family nutrient uptake outer membrane protein [Chitinophagaceae bacterium]|jgi:starch-binding outer membrane protein, SusD/RagB family|nr:RagB/SusD family nutrient uptake outer membrane protein [Chitinophagaceae bacterium]